MELRGAHILSADQFAKSDLDRIYLLAEKLEVFAQRQLVTSVLDGAVLANLFLEPSTRSRISFGAAFNRLGGSVRDTASANVSSIVKGESLGDTGRIVGGYADVIVIRHPRQGAVAELAEATNVPVINAGDGDGEHPTQALLDLYTLRKELGRSRAQLDGVAIAMVGDLRNGRTVHSLAKLLMLFPHLRFTFVAPDELQMPDAIVERLRHDGHLVKQTGDLADGVGGADAIYVTRIQEERFASQADADRYKGKLSIDRRFYAQHCKPGAVLMHPLPRDSRLDPGELSHDLDDHPALAIFRQADNGIPVRMALFALVLGVEDEIFETARRVPWFVPDKFGTRDVPAPAGQADEA